MLGFASGVMIAASFWSLLQPAIERAVTSSKLCPLQRGIFRCRLNDKNYEIATMKTDVAVGFSFAIRYGRMETVDRAENSGNYTGDYNMKKYITLL